MDKDVFADHSRIHTKGNRASVLGLKFTFPALWALIVFGAAGLFFGQPNTVLHLPVLVLLFPFSLYLLAASAPTAKRAALRGFLLGFAGNCAGLYWLVYPMHDVAELPFALAAPTVGLLCAFLACYTTLTAIAVRGSQSILDAAGGKRRWAKVLIAPLLAGMSYGALEMLCGGLFTGFPWLSLSSAFAFWPAWVQAASVTGSYGLSAVFAAGVFYLAAALLHGGTKQKYALLLLGIFLLAMPPFGGSLRLQSPVPVSAHPPIAVIMAQGNIDQNQKWEPAFQTHTLEHYLALSSEGLKDFAKQYPDQKATLVLWPETAMPFYFELQREFATRLRRFAIDNNVNLAFGSLGTSVVQYDGLGLNNTRVLHNRLYLLSPLGDLAGYYDKQHLVPFGEYTPFASNFAFLRNLLQGLDFSAGNHSELLPLNLPEPPGDPLADALQFKGEEPRPASQPISMGALICYEAIFPYIAQQQTELGALLLLNISNDAWFRHSSAPWQHLSLTAMRAVEQARPIVRSTNTGISAFIDSRGRVTILSKELFAEESMHAFVQPTDERTLYHRIYPLPEILLAVLALLPFFGYRKRRTTE